MFCGEIKFTELPLFCQLIVRAALDSIAYQVNDILSLIRKSSDVQITQLCVDGGATKNFYLMQFQ
ncbi:MAG: glycerol kinase, partial [Succinivibrio sp.]|nr:glycerol kinase [Succinivibrio sp.]